MSGASGNTIVAASPGLKAYAFLMTLLLAAGCSHILFPGFRQQWHQVRLGHSLVYAYNGDSGEYARLVATFPQGFTTYGTASPVSSAARAVQRLLLANS